MISDSTASKSIGSTLNKGNFPLNHSVPYQRKAVSTQNDVILTQNDVILTHKRPFLIYNSDVRAYDRDVILENLK